MTHGQAASIIALLEARPTRRVDIAAKAAQASDVLAVIMLVGGAILACVAVIDISNTGPLYGLTFLILTVAYSALSWGLLTTASVAAGYIANRSQ